MRKLTIAIFLLLFSLPILFNTAANAQFGQPADTDMMDEDLGIPSEDDLIKSGEEQLESEEPKELPPFKMVFVKGGCFDMGDKTGQGDDDERPVHEVCVNDFYIAETEVTQELFRAVMGFNISSFQDEQNPANNVSWFIANAFVKKLNQLTDGFYRIPTEAEWEYAARAGGKDFVWAGTNNEGELGDYAWFYDNADMKPHHVKSKKPNAIGLYDMSGNVWEWVEDNFDFDFYKVSEKDNPYGPQSSRWRVIRGGSFAEEPHKIRTTYRYAFVPTLRTTNIGFRLAE